MPVTHKHRLSNSNNQNQTNKIKNPKKPTRLLLWKQLKLQLNVIPRHGCRKVEDNSIVILYSLLKHPTINYLPLGRPSPSPTAHYPMKAECNFTQRHNPHIELGHVWVYKNGISDGPLCPVRVGLSCNRPTFTPDSCCPLSFTCNSISLFTQTEVHLSQKVHC